MFQLGGINNTGKLVWHLTISVGFILSIRKGMESLNSGLLLALRHSVKTSSAICVAELDNPRFLYFIWLIFPGVTKRYVVLKQGCEWIGPPPQASYQIVILIFLIPFLWF